MREIVRSNDAVLVSAVGALLGAAQIHYLVFDQNMSVLEGSLGVLPCRVLVADDDVPAARKLLEEAGLGNELRPDRSAVEAETTRDAVLGGRLMLRQPKRGHRVGHDAMLLAAITEAKTGEVAVDLGAGVGAAGLALAWRIPGVEIILAEIDPALCALARENARENGFADRARVLNLDVTASGSFDAQGVTPGSAKRVLMNPPFNDPSRQNVSPNASRRLAHAAPRETLSLWINTARRLLAPDGVLTLIFRADGLDDVCEALADFPVVDVKPVLPRARAEPIRVLVRARPTGAPASSRCDVLVLNDENGQPTAEVEAVLRGGAPLQF